MIKICVLNKYTNQCVGVYEIDDISNWIDHGDFLLASRHDGQCGWILENGEWRDPKAILKTEQEKWEEIRRDRDNLLQESDRYMIEDYPISQEHKNLAIIYRQQLRDLPQVYTNPDNIVWPQLIIN